MENCVDRYNRIMTEVLLSLEIASERTEPTTYFPSCSNVVNPSIQKVLKLIQEKNEVISSHGNELNGLRSLVPEPIRVGNTD